MCVLKCVLDCFDFTLIASRSKLSCLWPKLLTNDLLLLSRWFVVVVIVVVIIGCLFASCDETH